MELEKLKQIIATVLSVDTKEIKLETTFTEDLGADSLDMYQILIGVEKEFDVEFESDDLAGVNTVDAALSLLKSAIRK